MKIPDYFDLFPRRRAQADLRPAWQRHAEQQAVQAKKRPQISPGASSPIKAAFGKRKSLEVKPHQQIRAHGIGPAVITGRPAPKRK